MADKLALWGYSIDREVASLDFGDAPRRSSSEVRLRVKNRSEDYIASGVTVSVAGGTGPASQFYLSLDGAEFAATVSLGDLWPTAMSRTFWMRRSTPDGYPVSARNTFLLLKATSWTYPFASIAAPVDPVLDLLDS